MFRLLMALVMLGVSVSGFAGTLAVVDFEKAVKSSNFNPRKWELIVDSISKSDHHSLKKAS